ncbi:hypothetical protein BC332_33919 [Capsicum chinense]|nr:hypothetical protein BC332_33919 [Capsicum chinense]
MTMWILWKNKSMLPSENSKELHSTDQTEVEAGNVADQKVNDTADEKVEVAGDAAVDGGVFTPAPNPTVEVNKTFLVVGTNKDTPATAMTCFIGLVNPRSAKRELKRVTKKLIL